MSVLIVLLVSLIVMALVFYVIQTLLPLPAPWKNIILAVIALIYIVWLMSYFGVWPGMGPTRIRRW